MTIRPRALVGGVLLMATIVTASCDRPPPSPSPALRSSPSPGNRPSASRPSTDAALYLVWTPGGLTSDDRRKVRSLTGAREVAFVTGGLRWIVRVSGAPGPPPGYLIPLEVAHVDAESFMRTTDAAGLLAELGDSEAMLSRTSARLRAGADALELSPPSGRDGAGDLVRLAGRVLNDRTALGFEALLARPAPDGWGQTFALVRYGRRPEDLRRRLEPIFGARPFRLRAEGDAPFLRYADAVAPQLLFKKEFGEFAGRPRSDGSIAVDPGWLRRNILERRVPLLGRVECHRRLFAPLRRVLLDVRRAGLEDALKPEEYAGCFNPRFIGRDASGRLSSHSWGAALDVASASNALGRPPTLDRRIVDIFERHRFTWGGRWLIPDGMHFEWHPQPDP